MDINEIMIRRKNVLLLPQVDSNSCSEEKTIVVTMMKNIESLGFTFSKELFKELLKYNRDVLGGIYFNTIRILKEMVGDNVEYKPMYPNFPRQIIEMNEAELFANAILHYWSYGTWSPEYHKEQRLPLYEQTDLKEIGLGTIDDFYVFVRNLISSKTSLADEDKEILAYFVKEHYSKTAMPETIPYKENVAIIGKIYIENAISLSADALKNYFKTATDVLRLITFMSNGNVSLSSPTRYKHFKKRERRFFMNMLATCSCLEEDMKRYYEEWKRIGEIIHPGEFKSPCYDRVRNAFKIIREDEKQIQTYQGKVERLLSGGLGEIRVKEAVNLLMKRPGEFARALDRLLRYNKDEDYIINNFKNIVSKVSTPVLLQVKEHFLHRSTGNIRTVFPKGNIGKAVPLPPLKSFSTTKWEIAIVNQCNNALIENYKNLDFMGNVYINPELKNYIVPFSQRSASAALKTLTRGTRIALPKDSKVVRGFIWWTNLKMAYLINGSI
jgi:hypothetical protein